MLAGPMPGSQSVMLMRLPVSCLITLPTKSFTGLFQLVRMIIHQFIFVFFSPSIKAFV